MQHSRDGNLFARFVDLRERLEKIPVGLFIGKEVIAYIAIFKDGWNGCREADLILLEEALDRIEAEEAGSHR